MTSEEEAFNAAVLALKSGKVVGMPTETVYGLAGSIRDNQAIELIFSLKKRPFFDPLIVHIAHIDELKQLTTAYQDETVLKLAETFWPGPLTIILPKRSNINPLITSGFDTVGIRMPNHPLALRLIEMVGNPLAAPSANLFSQTSPTSKNHVDESFKDQGLIVLDGGQCLIGIESTVIRPVFSTQNGELREIEILRPGIITSKDLMQVLGENIPIRFISSGASPGNVKHHYMPKTPLALIRDNPVNLSSQLEKIQTLMGSNTSLKAFELKLSSESRLAARELYQRLREVPEEADLIYYVVKPNLKEDWDAILDRLNRAATYQV